MRIGNNRSIKYAYLVEWISTTNQKITGSEVINGGVNTGTFYAKIGKENKCIVLVFEDSTGLS